MDIYSRVPVKINSDADFAEFLEENKKKIPEDVIVERVESGHRVLQNSSDEGTLVIPAYALSLGLYLPLNPLISEILSNRGLKPIQLVPNCWRIMLGIIALNHLCNTKLGWKEFSHCYAVKENSGFRYFSLKKNKRPLVENLPKSEKDWKGVYISLKGNWGGARNENMSGEPAGAGYGCSKPPDWEVNMEDLRKAWSFQKKDWGYLIDPANWENDGAAVAGSSLLIDAEEEVPSREVILSSLENTVNEVVEQPGGETGLVDDRMTTNVSLSFQPHSKKQRTNHDSGSGGVAHDDHHIMNLESTPDHTRVCGGQEAAGDLSSHQILPNHSHFQSTDNIPPQLQHSVTPRAGIEQFTATVPTLIGESKNKTNMELEATIMELKAKNEKLEKELAEYKSTATVLTSIVESKNKTNMELEATTVELKVKNERLEKELAEYKSTATVLTSIVESKNKINMELEATIMELKVKNERLEKELAESKSATWKEHVGEQFEKSSTAEQFEGLRSEITQLKEMMSELTKKTKDSEGLRSEITQLKETMSELTEKTKDIEGLRSHLTQLKENEKKFLMEWDLDDFPPVSTSDLPGIPAKEGGGDQQDEEVIHSDVEE